MFALVDFICLLGLPMEPAFYLGMNAKDAIFLIESQGMVAKINGYGKVVSQSLAAGTPVYKGGVIEIGLQ